MADVKLSKEDLLAENAKLREALGQIQRMRILPDDKANSLALGMAHKIAYDALSALPGAGDGP